MTSSTDKGRTKIDPVTPVEVETTGGEPKLELADTTPRPMRIHLPDLEPGTIVGEYKVEGVLGEGGMGKVYAAVHPVIGKRVAVKVLRPELCTSISAVERFRGEAKAVNQIGHQNIVDIFAFDQLPDGRSYFVMEWLRGESLKARMKRTRLAYHEICAIADDVARALEAVHAKHIIHRDLKPDNVFLHQPENAALLVKLLDFGIAKLGSRDKALDRTRTGEMIGTPQYIAPEQARGEKGIDHRVDIYSFGAMLYELVAGRPPFLGDSAIEVVMKHVGEAPEPVEKFAADVSPQLADLIMSMLAKNPDDRPMLAEIRNVLGRVRGRESGAVMALETAPTVFQTKRGKKLIGAAVAACAVLIVGGFVLFSGGDGEKVETAPVVATPPTPRPSAAATEPKTTTPPTTTNLATTDTPPVKSDPTVATAPKEISSGSPSPKSPASPKQRPQTPTRIIKTKPKTPPNTTATKSNPKLEAQKTTDSGTNPTQPTSTGPTVNPNNNQSTKPDDDDLAGHRRKPK